MIISLSAKIVEGVRASFLKQEHLIILLLLKQSYYVALAGLELTEIHFSLPSQDLDLR